RDRAGTDVGACTHSRIPDIGQVIRLGAFLNLGGFDLDEIADVDVLFEIGTWTQPRVRADACILADMSTFKVRERADQSSIVKSDMGTDHDIWLDRHVSAEFRVC